MFSPIQKQYELAEYHSQLLKECFTPDLPFDWAMAVFAVLHTCVLRLKYPATGGQALGIAPITSRDCAESLASIWQNSPGSIFSADHFYRMWWGEWGGSVRLERVSQVDALVANEVKKVIESHPTIAEVIPEHPELNPFVAAPIMS